MPSLNSPSISFLSDLHQVIGNNRNSKKTALNDYMDRILITNLVQKFYERTKSKVLLVNDITLGLIIHCYNLYSGQEGFLSNIFGQNL